MAEFSQQGPKLVGTGAAGHAAQGGHVSLSSDGNTAIVGGAVDNGGTGAAWVFTRSGGVWTQQGNKLVGTGAIGAVAQGCSVSTSSDGNTAIVAGLDDNGSAVAWVFTRSGGVWTQQGSKLIGTGASEAPGQGCSVSLSADGNTAIIGGVGDVSTAAAWVFTRSGGVWSQQGNKLAGTGATGADQLVSASLSCDGNTAIVGSFENLDENHHDVGAAWVFTRSGGVWTQQGNKLVGTGAIGDAQQGWSVSLSCDGNTAIVGGKADNNDAGAAWVYVDSIEVIEVAIDPMALILEGKALLMWYDFKHPHEPKAAEIQQVLRSMTPEEQKATVNRARTLAKYGKMVEEAFATMGQ